MTKSKKTILMTAGIIAALFLPTIIAIISYLGAQISPVNAKSITKLEITDTNGKVYSLMSDVSSEASDIKGFVDINNRAIKQPSLPEPLVGSDYFEFKYYSYDRAQIYKYYFSSNPDEAYYTDANGTAYHINAQDADLFLSTRYARSLYNTTTFPTLKVSDNVVDPTSGNWIYQTYSGNYVALDDIKTAEPDETVHEMKGAFALNFDHKPDFCNVTISENGTVLFSDSYDNIANASLEGMTVDVEVDAKWYESEAETSDGAATYKFKAKVLMPAVFYLGETEIEPGEFVVISAKNVDDPSLIKFASEPDIGFTPTFFKDGRFIRALVPVKMDFEGSEVKFTCSYGEVSQEMTLDIKAKKFGSSSVDVSAAIASQTRTETTIKNFKDAMAPIVAVTEPTPLWDGLFIEALNADIRVGFGRYTTITGTGEVYRHEGCNYIARAGAEVSAVNNGKVVYAGYLDLTGYMVVIDHGLGLKSWYCHLGSTAVNVGDTVTKGDVVGYVGSTGFTSEPTLHSGYSVYDVPVCPYDLWDYGVIMTN